MSAYIVALVTINDHAAFERYRELAVPAVEKFEGIFLASNDDVTVLEGDTPSPRVVMVEFPSLEVATAFYHSPDYQEAIRAREGAATLKILAVEGT